MSEENPTPPPRRKQTDAERKAKAVATTKAWREADPERSGATSKAHYDGHKEEIGAKKKAWYEANKALCNARSKAFYEANKPAIAAQRKSHHEANKGRKYQLSPEELAEMIRACNGRCPCCKTPFSDILWTHPVVDHCHKRGLVRGAVRGILCNRCNMVLGHADDNPKILRACARHLEKFKRL